MRVLHFCKHAPNMVGGGMERVINELARGAPAFGVEAEVLHLSRDVIARTVEINGYRAHRARMDFQLASTGFSASVFLRFSQLARHADVIHYHFPWPFADLVHFAMRMNKPAVLTYHSDIIRQKVLLRLYRPLMNRFLSSVDRIVATSPNYLATSSVLQRHSDKVSVIPIGIDKTEYPPVTDERLATWLSRLSGPFFLFVGTLRYYKGLHILIEAARGLGCTIVIVGAGPIEAELRAQAAQLGVSNVQFLGEQPEADKVALLTLCRAVVFPSHLRSEAFGISLLEGAMFGKPMVSSEIGTGTTFVNIGGETGVVVPPGDPSALREAMRFLLHNPADAVAMGQRAERRYREQFTSDRMVAAYVDLYRQLLHSGPVPGG